MKKNPYKYIGPLDPIKDKKVCVQRTAYVEEVVQGLKNDKFWTIYGSRQSRKTTFLHLLRSKITDAHVVYVSCDILSGTEKQFYPWLIKRIVKEISFAPLEMKYLKCSEYFL
jgi:predicted AAA+ superfamily ATPase